MSKTVCDSLDDFVNSEYLKESRHDSKVKDIAERFEGFGYRVWTHQYYYDRETGRCLGEVDILCYDERHDVFLDVEVKTGNDVVKAFEQVNRFKDYFGYMEKDIFGLVVNRDGVFRV